GLAAGERGRRLAEPKIAEADVAEDAERPGQRAVGCEELHRVVHGHREHVGDRAASVLHAAHVGPVAPALALLAGDVHVLEEVHLELLEAVAMTFLAATPRHYGRAGAIGKVELCRPWQ